MSTDTPVVEASTRTKNGTAESRRLRRDGKIPAVVYGHGEETVSIAAEGDQVERLLNSGSQVADLSIDGKTDTALVKDVQWDTFSQHVLHVDFLRVAKGEKVEIEVPIELHGVSPGASAGGVLDHQLHALPALCPALQIPEKIEVNVNELEIGDSVHLSDLELPGQLEPQVPPETLVVQVNEPIEVPEEDETDDLGPAEPELVGREEKDEDEESGD